MGQTLPHLSSQQDSQTREKPALCISIVRWSISSHLRWHCWSRAPSKSFTHILTCIDWLTRRPIAVPLSDNLSETVAKKKLRDFWISMYENKNSVSIDFTVSPSLVNTNCYRTQHPSKASGSTSLNNPDTYLTAPSPGPSISQHKPTRSGRTIRLLHRLISLNTT